MINEVQKNEIEDYREVKEALENISAQMQTKVFETTIRESASAQQAQAKRTTLIKYAPNSTTAQDYVAFIKELLKKGQING